MPKKTLTVESFPLNELIAETRALPLGDPRHGLVLDDLAEQAASERHLGRAAKLYLSTFGPIVDAHADMSAIPAKYECTYRLIGAAMMANVLRSVGETTIAGTALPQHTRQRLLLVTRLFPRLLAPQLFGVHPMAGPTARVNYVTKTYASAHAAAPAIAVGDSIDDPTKRNTSYATHQEGTAAKQVTFAIASQDVSATDSRVAAEWSDRLSDETSAIYGTSAEDVLLDSCARVIQQGIDAELIDLADTLVPAGNTDTWDATPVDYISFTPSEEEHYDTDLYRRGFTSVLNKIADTCRGNAAGAPDWVLTGEKGMALVRKIRGFTSLAVGVDGASIGDAPIRAGEFADAGIRVFCHPSYDIGAGDTATAKFLFGRRPRGNEAALAFCPWISAKVTPPTYNASTGMTTRAVRSSHAILQPDNAVPESSQLVRGYGKLTVTL